MRRARPARRLIGIERLWDNIWDNAVAESSFVTLKTELFGDEVPESMHAVQRMLLSFVEASTTDVDCISH